MGLLDLFKKTTKSNQKNNKTIDNKKTGSSTISKAKRLTNSGNHEDAQVVGFNTPEDVGIKSDIRRDLYSFPKPEERETMADYISNHKNGDIFPYVTVTGKEEETREGRLARLRSFHSPYSKSSIPDMRVNGVLLDMLHGNIGLNELKDHVQTQMLSKIQKKENKKFRNIDEHLFDKPYVHIRRITGEFVPLISNTADYTDLCFSLVDDRLLENSTVVQSNKMPTNSPSIFELTCDYCLPTSDIGKLSLVYELARPIMKEDFQWGAVSLTLSISQSDLPYQVPKIETMAVIKAPYTAMEKYETDPDHKDITYTATQIEKFRDLYSSGDLVDSDEPLKSRLKTSSYSKSTLRGAPKAIKGPEHLGNLDGWSHLKDMKKPKLPDEIASNSIASGSDEEESVIVSQMTKDDYFKNQERLRNEMMKSMEGLKEFRKSSSGSSSRPFSPTVEEASTDGESVPDEQWLNNLIQEKKTKNLNPVQEIKESTSTVKKGGVRFNLQDI
jgi:hypothetical protein